MTKLAPLALLLLCGCAVPVHHYAGSPGSVYDSQAELPRVRPPVAYDPTLPVTPLDFGKGGAGADLRRTP